MRKVLSILCAAAMTAAALSGCGGEAQQAASAAASAAAPAVSAAAEAAPAAASAAAAPAAEAASAAVTAISEAAAGNTDAALEAASQAAEAASEAVSAASEAVSGGADYVIQPADMKIGIIYVGDENEGYSESHMNGIKEALAELGIDESQLIEKFNIPEDATCLDEAENLAADGCQLIFATSFGHESFLLEAAQNHPEIQFAHATGFRAAGAALDNFHNYFTNIYEARYVSGVAAGLKLKEMIDSGKITADQAKIGYVGAFPYAEVISGFTSFYLGARSIVPEATMRVLYTNSWADQAAEAETAAQLISEGCVLIGQHADTTGAPGQCQSAGVPCVGYNISMLNVAPDVALTSPTNVWSVYYKYAIESVMKGQAFDVDWSRGFTEGAVKVTELGTSVAPGTEEKLAEVEKAISDGSLHVFDTSTFTVGGQELTTYAPAGVELVSDGYFHESEYASAPAFDMIIDGIEAVTN